jgi:hypothetical protein
VKSRTRQIVVLCLLCAVALRLAAQIQVFDQGEENNFCAAAQNKEGEIYLGFQNKPFVWMWNRGSEPVFGLRPFNTSSSSQAGARAVRFDETATGPILSFWENERDGQAIFNVIDKAVYQVLPRIQGPARLARAIFDVSTNLWVTEAGLNILRLEHTPNFATRPKAELIHTITVDELYPGTQATNRLPVSMVEDKAGRIWFWSNPLLGSESRGSLRGALVVKDQKITHYPKLTGNPDNRITVIAPMNRTNIWIAARDVGIFSLDPDTFLASLMAAPETNAFRTVRQMFVIGEDRYVISGDPYSFDKRGLRGTLWRWRDGNWSKLIDGLDSAGSPDQIAERQWRVTPEGLWLTAYGTGGWFVPTNDAPARQINWQTGSTFDTIDRWFRLKDGRMVAFQFGRGGMVADAALLTGNTAVKATSQILRTRDPLLRTDDGRIFAVLRGDESALNEWTGKDWKRHAIPDNLQVPGGCRLAADAKGRVWLVEWDYPDSTQHRCLIFDPVRGRFEQFSSFQSALQTQATPLAGTRLGNDDFAAAVFSKDGRVCFEDRSWNLRYFNGREWRQDHVNQIAGGLRDSANRDPFFDKDDKLSVVLNGTLWQFEYLGGWRDTGTPASAVKKPSLAATTPTVATSPNVPDAESVVADQRGVFWIVARKQLYRAGYGLRVPCFPANEPHPFADGRKLTGVMLDNSGNAFLKTTVRGVEEYVLVPARGPLPDTNIKLQQTEGSAVLQLSAPDTTGPRFSWRGDDGDWNAAMTNTALMLDELPHGKHRIQVVAIDEQLQIDPSPAEITVEIKTNPAEQIQNWIRMLADGDYQKRESAVRSLGRYAEAALPALRKALESSPENQRWWIQAAIQQCEQSGGSR